MEKLVKFSKAKIEEVIDRNRKCSIEEDFVNLYKAVYDEWDKIKTITGYPKANHKTTECIVGSLANKHSDQKSEVMINWVNKGFSCDDTLDDWNIKLAPYELI